VEPLSDASRGSSTDLYGWEYSTSFDGLSQRTHQADRAVRRDVDTARRRRWTRVRAPTPQPLDDLDRPLGLFLEVARGLGGATEVRASSGVRVENHSGQALELGCASAAWPGAIVLAGPAVQPGQTVYLPLHLADTMHLALRAAPQQGLTALSERDPAASDLDPVLQDALAEVAANAQSGGGLAGGALVSMAPGERAQSSGAFQRAAAGFGAGFVLTLNPIGGMVGAVVAANALGGDEQGGKGVTASPDALLNGWPVHKVRGKSLAPN
jgi:hypothetical protein